MRKLLVIGGSSIHTYNYIDLVKEYFDDILLLTSTRRQGFDVKSIELDFSLRLKSMFGTISKIKKIASEYQPSIVHVHQANSYSFLTAVALRNSPFQTILTAWGSDVLVVPERNYFSKYMVRYALSQADVITSDSLYMATKIRQLCSTPPNLVIVNYGIHLNSLPVAKENIVFSNRLHKSLYNIEKIIIAFKQFIEVDKNWKLIVAGTGNHGETRTLMELTKQLGVEDAVKFTGWLDTHDNLNLYAKSKIYVSIPDSDATSISLLEAISHNCICFVSNLPANTEHILDKINGFIEDDLSNIDLNKYLQIDNQLLDEVNSIRSKFYSKDYGKKIFFGIFDSILAGREIA